MLKKSTALLAGIIYDVLIIATLPLSLSLYFIIPNVKKYLTARENIFTICKSIRKFKKSKSVLFYCSSMGELEQSLPVAKEFEKKGFIIIFFFFSLNGYNHAEKIGLQNIYKTPFDLFIFWVAIFKILHPDECFINRHEFWIGFISSCAFSSRLNLINCIHQSKSSDLLRPLAMWYSTKIFFVNEIPTSDEKRIFSGDTRIDRINERVKEEHLQMEERFKKLKYQEKKILVIGDAYAEDINIFFEAIKEFPFLFKDWNTVIIPHRPETLEGIEEMPSYAIIDQENERSNFGSKQVLILPIKGKLLHYYFCSDLAWVGGGFSKGLHNTFEPFLLQKNMISGPNIGGQFEAEIFIKEKKLVTFTTIVQLKNILSEFEYKTEEIDSLFPGSPAKEILKHF